MFNSNLLTAWFSLTSISILNLSTQSDLSYIIQNIVLLATG